MPASCVSLTNQSRALIKQPVCSVTQSYHVQQLDSQLACSALTVLSSLFLGSRGSFESLSICTGLLLQPRQLLCQMLHLHNLLVGCSLQVLNQWKEQNQGLQLGSPFVLSICICICIDSSWPWQTFICTVSRLFSASLLWSCLCKWALVDSRLLDKSAVLLALSCSPKIQQNLH